MAKVRPTAFWFYGNEKFILTAIAIALGTSGFVLGDSISDANTSKIRKGQFSWANTFRSQSRNLIPSPYHSELFHQVKDDAGSVVCIVRLRAHDDGRVSLLGVRVEPTEVNPTP